MATTTITIEKKKYRIIPEKEYQNLLEDIADIKKVLKRKTEGGVEASLFFKTLKTAKK